MPTLPRAAYTTSLLLLAAFLVLPGCAPKIAKVPPPPPQTVKVVKPVREKVIEVEEFTGRTAPVEMVELRSRVNGYLRTAKFKDGGEVKEGDLLFEIDKAPYVAESERATAAVDQFKARVDRMTRQYERLQELVRKNAASANDFDLVKFDRAEAVASLKAAEAQLEMAQLNLGYSEIHAPISGRISRRMVDPGNLVQADMSALATIVPLDKVYIYFDMDERTVLRLRRLVQDGTLEANYMTETSIDVALADSDDFSRQGKIDFEDNQIDAATGTLRVRAIVQNQDRFLSPGMFVRIRYPIGKAAPELLIPEEALGSDQGRPFVYVVGEENKVQYRPVVTGPLLSGRRVIRAGISANERVIVTGLQRIKKDQIVNPEDKLAETPEVAQVDVKSETVVLPTKDSSGTTPPKTVAN